MAPPPRYVLTIGRLLPTTLNNPPKTIMTAKAPIMPPGRISRYIVINTRAAMPIYTGSLIPDISIPPKLNALVLL